MKSQTQRLKERFLIFLMVVVVIAIVFDSIYRAVFSVSLFQALSMVPWDYVPLAILGLILYGVLKLAEW